MENFLYRKQCHTWNLKDKQDCRKRDFNIYDRRLICNVWRVLKNVIGKLAEHMHNLQKKMCLMYNISNIWQRE